MSAPSFLKLSFAAAGVAARAHLLHDAAPKTCRALIEMGGHVGAAHHGIYSGSECVLLLDRVLRLEPENATSKIRRGDVAFTWMPAGSAYGVDSDFAEICWFYDVDAQPRMWEGPVAVNVFAHIVEPASEFYSMCRRMRREGEKRVAIDFE